MEPLTRLRQKDEGDLLRIADDDAFWFELGEAEKVAFRPQAEAMVRDGMAAANETFGLRPAIGFVSPVDLAVRKQVDSYLDDWWLAIEHSERQILRGRFQALAAGEIKGGFAEFRRGIEDLYGTKRGRLIAETETTRLWTLGNEISMEQSGVKDYVWRSVNDDRVDEDCRQLNGQIFPVGGQGERPPKHPRCRCAIIPVPPELPELPPPDDPGGPFVGTETDEEREERERQERNAATLARLNATTTANPIPTSDPPLDLHGLRPATGARGQAKLRADALNRVISRNLAAMPPDERAKIVARSRQMRVGGAGKGAAGANFVDGSIRFAKGPLDDAVKVYADNPALLGAEGLDGKFAREGYSLVEHELTHSTWTRSVSYNAQANRPTVARVNQVARQKDLKFVEGDFSAGEVQDILADSMVTNGHHGWQTGKRFEEGLTDARTRDRLRLKLIDEHGVTVDRAFSMAEGAGAGPYDDFVRSMREVADEAIGEVLTIVQPAANFGIKLTNAGREQARFIRGLGSQVSRQDRADALARLFMEKWTVEIGPIAARSATGEILGFEKSSEFYRQMVSSFKSGDIRGDLGIPKLTSQTGLRRAREIWTREAASFADELAAANLRPDVDGVLALRDQWATAADLPDDMAFVLTRRADVMLSDAPAISFQ